jgi:Icc-related predicted phosphoesterase
MLMAANTWFSFMIRIAWMTDIHLNFLNEEQLDAFLHKIAEANPDIVLIAGDIGEAHSFPLYLDRFAIRLQRPVYFVLGNHDFYFGTVEAVRSIAERLTNEFKWLSWLPKAGVVELTPDTALIGHDGWADGRYGDYEHSEMLLNDYLFIGELGGLDKSERLKMLNRLGDESGDYFRKWLPQALERYHHVYVVTHVPPFAESCLYEGQYSNVDSLPHFSSKAVGDALLEVAQAYPDREITVLCGHTHSEARFQALPNLRVLTGGAKYGAPAIQSIIEI